MKNVIWPRKRAERVELSYNIFHSRDLLLICPLKTVQDAILTHRAFKICALFNFYFQIVLGSILRTRTPPYRTRQASTRAAILNFAKGRFWLDEMHIEAHSLSWITLGSVGQSVVAAAAAAAVWCPIKSLAKKTRRPPLIRRRRPTSLLSRVSQCTLGCS